VNPALRPVLFLPGRTIHYGELLAQASAAADRLPRGAGIINLCERRANFIAAFCAALLRGETTYLPAARAAGVVREVQDAHPGSIIVDDAAMDEAGAGAAGLASTSTATDAGAGDALATSASLDPPRDLVAALAFTSGTTGVPQRHRKIWGSLLASSALNARAIHAALTPRDRDRLASIVATVPPQHMYGFETSVLLPLVSGMAVHAGRPLFPADVAAALQEVPAPRILVTTPVHLRALVESGQTLPEAALVVSATAPLDAALAARAERAWNTRVLEMFGSTETCVIATRETAREPAWHPYPGVELEPGDSGTRVSAPWLAQTLELQDLLDLTADGGFIVRGRNADMIEVAGKRASLAELVHRIRTLRGVQDAAVFQLDAPEGGGVRRIAALVVAPGRDAVELSAELAERIDRAFLPRPLLIVDSLPRNEVGKLPRAQLIAALGIAEARAAGPAI